MYLTIRGPSFAVALILCWGLAIADLNCYSYNFKDSVGAEPYEEKACQPNEVCRTTIRRLTFAVTEYDRQCAYRPLKYKSGCSMIAGNKNVVECYCDSNLCNGRVHHGFDAFVNGANHKAATSSAVVLLTAAIGIMRHVA